MGFKSFQKVDSPYHTEPFFFYFHGIPNSQFFELSLEREREGRRYSRSACRLGPNRSKMDQQKYEMKKTMEETGAMDEELKKNVVSQMQGLATEMMSLTGTD